jgi:hypothetical protein
MVAIGRAGHVNVAQQQVNIQRGMAVRRRLVSHAEELGPHGRDHPLHASHCVVITAHR